MILNLVIGWAFYFIGRSASHGSSYGQEGIKMNRFQLLGKRHCKLGHKGHHHNQDGALIKALRIVISSALGKRFCNLRGSPVVLIIFPNTNIRWSSNFNWLSSIIRKCFWEDVRVALALLSINLFLICY